MKLIIILKKKCAEVELFVYRSLFNVFRLNVRKHIDTFYNGRTLRVKYLLQTTTIVAKRKNYTVNR